MVLPVMASNKIKKECSQQIKTEIKDFYYILSPILKK